MTPKASFWGKFSPEGRIKNLWAQALAEPNPDISLNQLREVLRLLLESPAELHQFWIAFLDVLLTPVYIHRLTGGDLLAIENMGQMLARGFARPLRPEDVWFRLLNAYVARSQEPQVRAFFTRIYSSPSATWEEKARCAHELVYRQEMGEQAALVYIDYLQRIREPGSEPAMLKLLGEMCAVDFTTDRAGLERAGMLARHLSSSKLSIPVDGLSNALGLYALLIERSPSQAVYPFTAALNVNAQDRTALAGVLSCRILLGQHSLLEEMARQPQMSYFARDPIISGLLQLSSILNWLDNQEVEGPLPGKAEAVELLRILGLRTYVGDLVDATLGRLYLLAGNARRARDLLIPLLGTNPQFPQWAYYATWAEMLSGNRDGVAYCFSNVAHWSGKWTVACLLIDADPVLAEKNGAFAFLRGILSSPMHVKPGYLPLIQARLAMAQSSTPAPVTWQRDTASVEEDLEALRTMLGYLYHSGKLVEMEHWIAHPLLARLPLADQLLWRGLAGLHIQSRLHGCLTLLDKAATSHGYYRAALILTLHYLQTNQLDMAKTYLSLTESMRDDGRTALLRAYIAGREGQRDEAIQQLEQISTEPGIQARAFFAAGNLLLQKASQAAISGQAGDARKYRGQAVQRLDSGLRLGKDLLPGQAEVVWRCAQFISQPAQQKTLGAALWRDLERLDSSQHHPWLKWNAMLGRLWYSGPDEVIAASDEISFMLDATTHSEESVVNALALALAAVSTRATQGAQINQLLPVLERIATRSSFAQVKQTCDGGITLTLREFYKQAGIEQRYQVRQELMRRASAQPSNEQLALLLAAVSVENKARLAAINALRNARSQRNLLPYLADLLDQPGQLTHAAPEPEQGSSPAMRRAYEVLQVAETFSSGQPEQGYETLNKLLLQHGPELTSLVKIGRVLPHLCAYSMQAGGAVPPVIADALRALTAEHVDDEQHVLLARCATAIGELELAESLWEQALKREPPQKVRLEYTRFFNYRAAHAYLAGDEAETVRYLRQAASGLASESI